MNATLHLERKDEVAPGPLSPNAPTRIRRQGTAFIDLDNPLRGIELEPAVESFASMSGLQDLTQVLLRGAYLSEDPDNYRNVVGLSDADKVALTQEYNEERPWKILRNVPKALRTVILTCSLAAITQGWDQVSMSAANQYWPAELGLNKLTMDQGSPVVTRDDWLFGFINACPFFFSAIVGTWLSDPLNEQLMGRRSVIFFAAIFSLISVIGAAACQTWMQLLICRLLLGIGMGCKAAVVPIYAAETAPTKIRGGVVMNWQLSVAIGGVIGSSCNLALFNIQNEHQNFNWRLQLAVAAIPAIPLLLLSYVCPESPRFLIKKRKWRAAFNSLRSLNDTDVQAARELFLIHIQNELTKIRWYGGEKADELVTELFPPATDIPLSRRKTNESLSPRNTSLNEHVSTYIKRLVNLFAVPRIRRATTAAAVVMISQQLCGINLIAFYSGTIIPQDGDSGAAEIKKHNLNSLWLGWGSWVIVG